MTTKIIHQIWLGDAALPLAFAEWAMTWRAHHPDWEYKLWTDKEAEQFPLYQKLAPHCAGPASKADLLRLLILESEGGMYADFDAECVGSFGNVLTGHTMVMGACGEHWNTPEHPWNLSSINGWIYAQAGCPQFKEVVRTLEKSVFSQIIALTFSGPWLEAIAAKSGGVHLFPFTVLTPNAPWEPVPDPLPTDCLSVHHWEGSWLTDASRKNLNLGKRKVPISSSQPLISTPA